MLLTGKDNTIKVKNKKERGKKILREGDGAYKKAG